MQHWKEWVKDRLPAHVFRYIDQMLFRLRRFRIQTIHRFFALLGLNIVRRSDYYSVLPCLDELARNQQRWNRPSAMGGLRFDLGAMKVLLLELHAKWGEEFDLAAGDYAANLRRGFGPGYTRFDARTLYYFLREWKPRHYLEIGSGTSTFYASLAAQKNAVEGTPLGITCVEPYPYDELHSIPGIEIIQDLAQNIPLATFDALDAGDVLFIDSSHAFKIDSDVAWLLLEALPRLKTGVNVHIHDIPFPYNIPFPANTWLFGERWPKYWNEAMAVQAFLAFNSAYRILMSAPMLRHTDESFFQKTFSDYKPLASDESPAAALWLRRIA